MKITIETKVTAPIEKVWAAWTSPSDITRWNAASDDWCCPTATNDLRVDGTFCYRMEARDGSAGFDFEGTYIAIEPNSQIEYRLGNSLGNDRTVVVEFQAEEDSVILRETFVAEDKHTAEQQREGWKSILQRFKTYVEEGQ